MTESGVRRSSIVHIPSVVWSHPPHPSIRSSFKRSLDISGALIGLLTLALIFIPMSIAIRLDSPGPILFKQRRYGYQGRPFTIWKFRSMVRNADKLKSIVPNQAEGLIFKNDQDPRITRMGRFLRRTSLDEFPQFWNVLRGEMSLVGTRPPTHDEVIHYKDHHWKRLNVKPGMTGEWQVNGRSTIRNFEDIVELDLLYQERWTPLYDICLILKTLIVLFTRTGAY